MRRFERLADVFRSERRRRQVRADRDCRVVGQVARMALCTLGNNIQGGLVIGPGPYSGISESAAIKCFADLPRLYVALKRLGELVKQPKG